MYQQIHLCPVVLCVINDILLTNKHDITLQFWNIFKNNHILEKCYCGSNIDKILCCWFSEINYTSLIQQDLLCTVCCHNSMLYNSSFSIVEMMQQLHKALRVQLYYQIHRCRCAYITIIIKSKRIMVQKINEAQTMTTKNHFSFYPACISFLVFPCTKSIRPKVGNSGLVFFSYRLKNVLFIQIDRMTV